MFPLEVGGEDVAVLMSTGNTVSNLTGIFIPLVATMFRTRFGAAWASPFFAAVSIFHMLCAGVFCVLARVDSARCLQTAGAMQEKMSHIKQQVADAAKKKRRKKEQQVAKRKGE